MDLCATNIILILFSLFSTIRTENEELFYNELYTKVFNIEGRNQRILEVLSNGSAESLAFLKMIDASSKIPSGILDGNFIDVGNFDQCYNIESNNVYGKYCIGLIVPDPKTIQYLKTLNLNSTKLTLLLKPPQNRALQLTGAEIGFQYAICIPHTMDTTSLTELLNFKIQACYSKATEPELSNGGLGVIMLLSALLALILSSTTFDLILYYTKQKVPHELFIAFSLLTNGRKLFTISKNPEQLLCLNGIKTISMMWIVLGHTYILKSAGPFNNLFDLIDFSDRMENQYVLGAAIGVDTFLLVAGLVVTYSFLKAQEKGFKFNILLYYLHRYLRLTPVYVILGLMHLYLLNYFGRGPLWHLLDYELVKPCERAWWSSYLYITNYVLKGSCLPQTWYLTVDMQLFVLSPLVLIPLKKWPKFGQSLLLFLTVLGCVVPFFIVYNRELGKFGGRNFGAYTKYYYYQTHARFGPYVIGMLLGYFLYKIKKDNLKIRLPSPSLSVPLLWLGILTTLSACVFSENVIDEDDNLGFSLFAAFDKPAWAAAVAATIFLCITGYGGPINTFLSLPIFEILTKLSYSMYLTHLTVIFLRYATMKTSYHYSHMAMLHAFWGDFMFTLFVSMLTYLSFEAPVFVLEKHLVKFFTKIFHRQHKKTQITVSHNNNP